MSTPSAEVRDSRLKLTTSAQEGATLVECHGRLTAEVSPSFKNHLKGLIPGARRIVLDLSQVTFMDSSGLGAIMGVYVSAKTAKCDLRLVNLSRQLKQLLGMTHLLSLFEPCGQYSIKLP
jgi:anti-anti-sigma factor